MLLAMKFGFWLITGAFLLKTQLVNNFAVRLILLVLILRKDLEDIITKKIKTSATSAEDLFWKLKDGLKSLIEEA
jgi:hypothetical protein